jgi:hypothetical protein
MTHLRPDRGDGLAGDSLSGDGHVRPNNSVVLWGGHDCFSGVEKAVRKWLRCPRRRGVGGEPRGALDSSHGGQVESCSR